MTAEGYGTQAAESYRRMLDDELLELAKDKASLTSEAAAALEVEIRERGLAAKVASAEASVDEPCPLCSETMGAHHGFLYGTEVCAECRRLLLQRRFLAYAIDSSVLAVLFFVIFLLAIDFAQRVADRVAIVALLVLPAFHLLRDAGALSIGKRLTGLEVIDARTGQPAGAMASLKRNIVLEIPGL